MSQTLKSTPIERNAEPAAVSDDLLARIVTETERQVASKANRPSPIRLRTLDELERFADIAARSTAVPRDYQNKPDNCMIAIQMGSELGLAPMQSLQNIAVINGRPAVWGDAMPGLCRASGMMSYMHEWSDGEGEDLAWHCETKRRDDPNAIVRHFSVADAKVAKLWGKKGNQGQDTPWITNPGRMLQMRARGFALRDAFPDVLRGLISAEEAADMTFGMPEPDARAAINAEVPLRAAAAVASVSAAMPRSEKLVDKAQVYETTEDTNQKWLRNLETKLSMAQSQAEVVRISDLKSVKDAAQYAPAEIKQRVSELLADAYARFPAEEDLSDEALGEVEIEGEAKVMAGDD
jgi:hypothetical protein